MHRDVKPSNVLLTLDGPRLIDFGIARATDGTASLTSTGVSVGSPGYMSPEQILGKGVTGAADVFSLGAVLAYAATGEAPFPGDSSAALLYKVVHEEPELDGLEGELRELVAACLAKDPARAARARRRSRSGWRPAGAAALGGAAGCRARWSSRPAGGGGTARPGAGRTSPGGPQSGPVPFSRVVVGPRRDVSAAGRLRAAGPVVHGRTGRRLRLVGTPPARPGTAGAGSPLRPTDARRTRGRPGSR